MEAGDRLYMQMQKVIKDKNLVFDEKVGKIREYFAGSLDSFPDALTDDLFDSLFEGNGLSEESLEERSILLPSLTQLMLQEFDDRTDPFSVGEWKIIGEVISEYGIELDERTLTYIMGKVVERGAI
ncbi:MAG: hypothetical protein ACLFNZ_07005 [Spirochaetaceae bacterium]